tara:strand:- start:62 stop:1063 length:1002 start_codon:yes stop_codon:yes gene_type:complete
MGIFTQKKRIPEIVFNLEKDFEREIFDNYKLLFGSKTILIDTKKKISGRELGATIPDGFLFDLSDEKEPRFYLIEVELTKHSFYNHIFPQITKFFAFYKNQNQRIELTKRLDEIINSDQQIKSEFKKLIGDEEIFKFLSDLIENNQNILIVIDGDKPEISEVSEVYHDTWGKMVKCITMKKYSGNGETIYQLEPELEVLDIIGDERVISNKTGYDEGHLTSDTSAEILKTYNKLKEEVLKLNPNLIFNPTKSYISIKGPATLAYMKFTKSKMRLIPLRPEEEIRECISKYEIKSFPDSVKKFWNGECAGIIIEDDSGLNELVNVLKPLVLEDQ